MGCLMRNYTHLILFVFLVSMLGVGCTGSGSQKASAPDVDNSDNQEPAIVRNEVTVSPIKIYDIGDTCSDNLTKITVNGKRYANSINEKNDESHMVQAESGFEYLILDITLENISPNRSRSYAAYWHYKILSPEGYTYEMDRNASSALSKKLDGSDVMPGTKRRGEVPFKVPIDAEGLQLQFMWDPIKTHDAVLFNL